MKVDLHTHSYYSDGKHSPDFVIERALERGVTHIALTDHDCVDGVIYLQQQLNTGITLVPGVEISAMWQGIEIHIVGLCIDPLNQDLSKLLGKQQEKRFVRLGKIDSLMAKAGIPGLSEFLENQNCVSPSRSHAAEFLIAQGKVNSRKAAFKSLSRNGRFFVKPDWCTVEEAVNVIQQGNGIAVLAHPNRYPLSNSKLKRLIKEFKQSGGDALEVCYSNISNDVREYLARLSEEFELAASVGSDFHDASATWMDVGKTPALPETCKKNAIWLHPRWHS